MIQQTTHTMLFQVFRSRRFHSPRASLRRRMAVTLLLSILVLVFLPNMGKAQTTTRVSIDSNGVEGNLQSGNFIDISANGQIVAFASEATNLVPEDTNRLSDVFVHDRQTGQTTRVSVSSAGEQAGGRIFVPRFGSRDPGLSADGRYVTFESDATNLVTPDRNGIKFDVFVHDRQTGETAGQRIK